MALTNLDCAAIACIPVVMLLYLRRRAHKSKLPLPPGPPRWPLIGSLLSLPRNGEPNWSAFLRWSKESDSEIVYIPLPGQNMVVLNTRQAAVELLERRSGVYSDRPHLVMAGDLVGWDQLLGFVKYGNKVRRIRKMLWDGMNPKAMQNWFPLQEQEALKFLHKLLHKPENFVSHIRHTAGASVLKLAYGYTAHDESDEYVVAAEKAMESFSVLTMPGAFMVDIFPWLQYIPSASFKRTVIEARKSLLGLSDFPMEYVHKQMRAGKAEPSFASNWLEQPSQEPDHEYVVKWAAASLYGGGADTTVSSICTFFIAMLYNPSAQNIAQAEIEHVVGAERLPTCQDRESLPYVQALYKEVLRWQPVAPLGVPHRYTGGINDEYKGVRIPAGSVIISNIWAMIRDPSVYKSPEDFNPSRFLGPEPEEDPENIVFGFGRRRCPGIPVAESSIWLSIVLTLAAYNISPVVGEDGEDQLPSLNYSNTTVSHPPPFRCIITPRSERMKQLVEDAVM